MTEKTDRFYVPSRPTIIEGFRALRAALEKVVEARGGDARPGLVRRWARAFSTAL
jgi:hypothetical protein